MLLLLLLLRACSRLNDWLGLGVQGQLANRQGGADMGRPATVPCYAPPTLPTCARRALFLKAEQGRSRATNQSAPDPASTYISSAGSRSGAHQAVQCCAVLMLH
jgi:hypothetical protein